MKIKEIKELYEDDKPREKLLSKGSKALKNYELIALILGSGQKNTPLFKISKEIEKLLDESKGEPEIDKLQTINGVGKAKACQIVATIELAKRYHTPASTYKITSAGDVYEVVKEWKDKKQEHFITITLDGANNLIEKRVITIGTVNQSLVHPREVFADAITDRAASIILCHNHPSGTMEPSKEDIVVTKRLSEAGKMLGIEVLDHVIFGSEKFYSFKSEGIL